jgi:hypothetical protein
MLIPTKLGLTGITPPEKQTTSGKNPAYEEGVKKINKERVDTVKYLRETEARIRTVQDVLKEVGTESAFGKQQKAQLDQLLSDQATYNKKIKFLDSRLKDPKLISTYIQTKQPIPEEFKPSFGQEVLLGEKAWQKALVSGQNKYTNLANNALDAVGFKYVPDGLIKDITKGVLNPLSYTQTAADIFGNPTKFMDDTFYTMANPKASAEERALSGLNFVLFVASVVPGAAALKKGGVKQLLDEAVEKAVKAGVKVESAVNKVKNALDPATYKAIIDKSKTFGTTVVEKGKSAVQKGVSKIDEALSAPAAKVPGTQPSRQSGFINLSPVVDFIFSKNKDTKSLLDKLKVGDPSAVIRPVYDRLIESGLTPERARAVEREISQSFKSGSMTLTLPSLSANEQNAYNSIIKLGKDQLVEKNGVLLIFPKDLQLQIETELKKINPTIASKLFSRLTPFITEKRAVATKLPSLLPTAELRATDVATYNKAVKENAKTYLDIAKGIRNVDDNLLMPIRNLLTNTSIDDILKNKSFDTIINDANLPQSVRDLATQLRDKIITIDELGKAGTPRKIAPKPGEGYKVFDNSKTLYENLTEGLTKDVALDTIYGKAFSFNKYLDLSPEQLKKIDPIAFLFEIDNSAARKQAFRGSVVTRNVITDFIKDAVDNPANNFTKAQKDEVNTILEAFNSTVEQLTDATPKADTVMERFFGILNAPYLAKISGVSQVAGNVGTALSQLPPLAQNVAINGIVDSLSGIMSVMKGGFGDAAMKDIWSKSSFLANRLETNTQDALYANMKKEYFKQFGKETQVMLRRAASKYGEDVVQRISRTFISKMDEAVSKTFWTSSYNRALKAGVSEKEAIAFADFITERTLSGREKGALPEIFTNNIGKTLFQYGLEVLNQIPTGIDFYRDKTGGVLAKSMKAFDAALKYSVAAYLINNAVEKANNRRPAFDPIGLTEDYLKSQDKTSQSPFTEKAKGLPLVGPALATVAGRAPSKSFIGNNEDFVLELGDSLLGVSKVSLKDLPSMDLLFRTGEYLDIFRGQGAYENVDNLDNIQAAAREEIFLKLLPGGNQAKKTLAGLRAIGPDGYVDERKIKEQMADESLKYDVAAFDRNKAVVAYRNALQRAEKNVQIPVPPEVMQAMQALLFGAKGTTEYRVKTASLADFDNEIKRLEAEKKIKPDMKDALQTKIDDVIERRRKFLGMKREPGKE